MSVPFLEPQIRCNMAIAEEGLRGNYGANIGSVLLDMEGNDVRVRQHTPQPVPMPA